MDNSDPSDPSDHHKPNAVSNDENENHSNGIINENYGQRSISFTECYIPKRNINVQRNTIDWYDLQRTFGELPSDESSLWSIVNVQLRKSWKKFSLLQWLISLFPIIQWLPKYSRAYLFPDFIAGFTIGIIQIPQGIAYSLLAGLNAVNGLYLSFFPVLIYSFMASSRHNSIGSFAVTSLMLSEAVSRIGAVSSRDNITMSFLAYDDESVIDSEWPPTNLELLTSIGLFTGLIQLGMGFLRLGSLSVILSEHLVSGFSTGVCIHVAVSQLNGILGLAVKEPHGVIKIIKYVIGVIENLGDINYITILCTFTVMAILIFSKEIIDPFMKKKLSFPLPIDLLVVIFSTLIAWLLNLESEYKVSVVGEIPRGLPKPEIPRVDLLPDIIKDCILIAIINYAVTYSLAKICAKNYEVSANQELIALGSANIFGSFFLTFPAAAALSRSTLQEKIGGKTQIAGFISCIVILIVLLFVGPLLYHLPKCTLAAIILVALKALFLQFTDVPKLWKISKLDAITWIITFVSTVLLDVDYGLIIGVAFSIGVILIRLILPSSVLLGQLPSTEIYVDLSKYQYAKEIKGIVIFRFSSPIFYLNRETFKSHLFKCVFGNNNRSPDDDNGKPQSQPKAVIIDFSCVPFIDSSGAKTIEESIAMLKDHNINVRLASCQSNVLELFEKTNFLLHVPKLCITASVHDAVMSLNFL